MKDSNEKGIGMGEQIGEREKERGDGKKEKLEREEDRQIWKS